MNGCHKSIKIKLTKQSYRFLEVNGNGIKMRYTRYDIKKKKNDNVTFLFAIIVVLILSFVIGTIIFQALFKNNMNIPALNNRNSDSTSNVSYEEKDAVKFIVIQGGVYEAKQNVDITKTALSVYGNPFSIDEQKNTRVLLGIYSDKNAEEVVKKLNEKAVENSKIIFEVKRTDACNTEICEIIDANLQILNALDDKNVQAVQTAGLKKWCSTLNNVEASSKNYAILVELKNYINNLPAEVVKEKVPDNYVFLYNTLKKM